MPTRKSFLVLGAGLMGKAIAFDLVHSSPHYALTLADIDKERAQRAASALDTRRV